MTIEIRRARSDEADFLTDLSMRSKRSNGYDDAFMEACREELTVTASRLEEGEYWVAQSDVVCGCACLLDVSDGYGEVHAFFIDPDFQRQGIGRALWLKLVERAKARDISVLSLDADPAAVPFYRVLGFVEVGKAPSGSIEGRTLPRMEIRLD
ncbi:MAG: GNAT family N-acetyltransferase [Geminicoccaceae bacterium]